MSYIPSHAMPHTYVHEEEAEENAARKRQAPSNALKIAGGALLGYLLYRALR